MAVAVPPVGELVVQPEEPLEAGQPQQPCQQEQQQQQPSQDSGFFEPDCPRKRSLTDDEVAVITSLADKLGDAEIKRRERVEKRRIERARLRDAFYATAPIAAAVAKKRNDLKKRESDEKDD